MSLTPDPWWPLAGLALILLGDALLSLRPPKFIQNCLNGVGYPREWWWTLIVIKIVAAAGLLIGIWADGIGLAATAGVIGYFVCATIAHIKARFTGTEFWINCLGMLGLSAAVLTYTYAI